MSDREGVLLFNGRDGEWLAQLDRQFSKGGDFVCVEKIRPQIGPPDIWLLFSPLKKTRTNFIVEKATEMGVAKLIPVRTRYTNTKRVSLARLRSIAIEAAEQCGALDIPAFSQF